MKISVIIVILYEKLKCLLKYNIILCVGAYFKMAKNIIKKNKIRGEIIYWNFREYLLFFIFTLLICNIFININFYMNHIDKILLQLWFIFKKQQVPF